MWAFKQNYKAILSMTTDQSQATQRVEHHHLRRAASMVAGKFDLGRIDMQVLTFIIESLTWTNFDPRQEIIFASSNIIKALHISDISQVSKSISRLRKLELIQTRRVGVMTNKRLTDRFLEYAAKAAYNYPVTSQNNLYANDHKSNAVSIISQMPPESQVLLDRRVNKKLNKTLKEEEAIPAPPPKRKVVFLAKEFESLFAKSNVDIDDNNAWFEKAAIEKSPERVEEFIAYAKSRVAYRDRFSKGRRDQLWEDFINPPSPENETSTEEAYDGPFSSDEEFRAFQEAIPF